MLFAVSDVQAGLPYFVKPDKIIYHKVRNAMNNHHWLE
ncbi:hypothetical protein AC77_5546 [Escherichia coli 5-366-08_S4_C1]|nr:hypothetical protein AC77_5546 [Escherichia coli 5-366-08_S4_C1]